MHIALLSPAWPLGHRQNGIVTYTHYIAEALVAQGHRVTVLAWEVAAGAAGSNVVQVDSSSLMARLRDRFSRRRSDEFDAWKKIALQVDRIDAKTRVDVLEMEETFGWAAEVAEHVRPALVVKLHGPAFLHLMEEEAATARGRLRIESEGRALSRLPVITAPSEWTLTQTLARYQLHPPIAEAIANPIGGTPRMPTWARSNCDVEHVLFVGRFDKVKGGDLVVRAFAHLLKRRPALRLTFIGPDPGFLGPDGLRLHLHEFTRLHCGSAVLARIAYMGALSPLEAGRLRVTAAVTVVASRQESLGYTAMEAMRQGCPLVVSDSSGLAELVEHEATGLKARPEDAIDFADQIERLLADPDLASRLGSAARDAMLARYSPSHLATKLSDIYLRAIERRGATSDQCRRA